MIEQVPIQIMKKATQTEIIKMIDEDTQAIQIIINHENPTQCSVIISDEMFTVGYETTYNNELIAGIKKTIQGKEILLIQFIDNELNEAWKQSYIKGGITEDRFDRRVVFHPYNHLQEMFCIDRILYCEITDYFKGTDHELTEEKCAWKWHMVNWYKNQLI